MNYQDWLPKFAAGTATDAERDAFNNWLQSLSPEAFREVLAQYEALLLTHQQLDPHNEGMLQNILSKLENEKSITPVRSLSTGKWRRYAAAVLVLMGIGTWFLLRKQNEPQTLATKEKTEQPAGGDIPPGTAGALLTLADGRTILLDSLQPGAIAEQGSNILLKEGELSYAHWQQNSSSSTPLFNTMQTPRGRQFQLTLPDGTRVWLNAMSSIRFPVSFPGNTREVSITGEAYLEVAKDAGKPFIVRSNGITTEVLGTSFNVNAYEDEDATRITLLEGKVRVRDQHSSMELKPGMQARQNNAGIKLAEVDTDQIIAWKNGLFNFNQISLQSGLRQIARWYDVEVVYEKNVPGITFAGKIQRNLSLQQILKGLEDDQVHFRIEGKKLIVSP
ncbi:FecR domain-containing protein [Pseudoflavitalea rhizosphaerae]|uniref:FecR domain-containing protein n=1 Tax=Pseudoflavitalea rhizosphaerae TaxID=1884793 RepID=UPI000F8D914C|nr:FecR domain-containing protein [Pseudoflavitalea rhizosphaerae]